MVEVNIQQVRGSISGYYDNDGALLRNVKLADKNAHDGIYFSFQRKCRRSDS